MKSFSLANLQVGLTFAACICLIILIYRIYKSCQDYQTVTAHNANRSTSLASLRTSNHRILNDSKGQQGEDALHSTVLRICAALGIDGVTNREVNRPHAILPPLGHDVFSKEIDLVLVCALGIYVFEVKNWEGEWSPNADDPRTLKRVRPNNQRESRPAPLAKTQRKLEDLMQRSGLTSVAAEALVVFTHPAGRLNPHLPPNYIHIDELQYYFRTQLAKKKQREEYVDVPSLGRSVWGFLDGSATAFHNHMMRLSPTTDSLKAYQTNHRSMLALEKRPIQKFELDKSLQFWGKQTAIFFGLAYLVAKVATWF